MHYGNLNGSQDEERAVGPAWSHTGRKLGIHLDGQCLSPAGRHVLRGNILAPHQEFRPDLHDVASTLSILVLYNRVDCKLASLLASEHARLLRLEERAMMKQM